MTRRRHEDGERRGLTVTWTQLVGAGVATAAATVAASFLGVYGTVIGAALMSVISTAGTVLVQRGLSHTNDQVQRATQKLQSQIHPRPAPTARHPHAPAPASGDPSNTQGGPGTRDASRPFAAGSAPFPASGSPNGQDTAAPGSTVGAADADHTAHMEAAGTNVAGTHPYDTASGDADGADPGGGDSGSGDTGSGDTGSGDTDGADGSGGHRRLPRWAVWAISAVVVFAVVMGVVTLVELAIREPLSSAVRGEQGSGTTFGGGRGQATPTPGTTTSPGTSSVPATSRTPTTGESPHTTAPDKGGSEHSSTTPEPSATTNEPTANTSQRASSAPSDPAR